MLAAPGLKQLNWSEMISYELDGGIIRPIRVNKHTKHIKGVFDYIFLHTHTHQIVVIL